MNDYEQLLNLIDDISKLIDMKATSSTPELKAWNTRCKIFLSNKYGKDSEEYNFFEQTNFFPLALIGRSVSDQERIEACQEALLYVKNVFSNLLFRMEMQESKSINKGDVNKNKVFIVHGHDSELKYRVSNLLRKIGLKPIILHEKINTSDTIIEKLERFGEEATAAVILFTPDDFGQAKTEEERKTRARQNVVFEAGYFMGLLGRKRTILIVPDSSIELPGDLSGVVYTDEKTVEINIAEELKAMGLPVDMSEFYE